MAMMKRPELGELKPGQWLLVRRSRNDMRGRNTEDWYISAKVVKAARVWVLLEGIDVRQTWRMRRDTQDEATRYSGGNASFVTMEQHAWDKDQTWARDVLTENGIQLGTRSRWAGREFELANLIMEGVWNDRETDQRPLPLG